MKFLQNLKVITFALLLSMTGSIIYSFLSIDVIDRQHNIWFMLSIFELGTISILAFIVFKLIDIIENFKNKIAISDA